MHILLMCPISLSGTVKNQTQPKIRNPFIWSEVELFVGFLEIIPLGYLRQGNGITHYYQVL